MPYDPKSPLFASPVDAIEYYTAALRGLLAGGPAAIRSCQSLMRELKRELLLHGN